MLLDFNAQYQKGEEKAWADLMTYDGTKKETTLTGDARFIDGQPTQEFNKKLLRNNKEAIIEAYNYNLPFLEKADKIILLGKLRTEPIFKHHYSEFSSEETLIHPSRYNSQKAESTKEWESIWNTKYLFNKIRTFESSPTSIKE